MYKMNVHKKTIILRACLLSAFFLLTGASDAPADSTKSIHLSVNVLQNCNFFNNEAILFDSYALINEGGTLANTDLSMGCGNNTPINIAVTAGGQTLLSETILDNGFPSQLHIEQNEDGSFTVERCDSLDDVPLANQSPLSSNPEGETVNIEVNITL